MKPPHVQVFNVVGPEGPFELAAIVIDREEFDALIDEIVKVSMEMGIKEEMGRTIKECGNIPMVARGTKTAFIFERYGVKGDRLSVIVRGMGEKLLQGMIPDPRRN